MLFNYLLTHCKKIPNHFALNNITFKELISIIDKRKYTPITDSDNVDTILDILKALSLDKPIVVLPKYKVEIDITSLPNNFNMVLFSSGSTKGVGTPYFLNQKFLETNIFNSIECHKFNYNDKVLTVCSLRHTGGINAQTLPALFAGSHVIIESFNPHHFFSSIQKHKITKTHVVPRMTEILMKIKNKKNYTLDMVTSGSDCVYKEQVKFWLERSKNVIINYGLTQAGPIIINHCFTNIDELDVYNNSVLLGTKIWCKYKIIDGELCLKGNNVASQDWVFTDDCIELQDNWFIYKGRKSAGCKIVPKTY